MDAEQQQQQPSPQHQSIEGSTRCDCCKSCGAVVELDGCGHRFHPRCIYTYPLTQCELCSAPVAAVRVFRPFTNATNTMARKGKWSADEHKYANMMMKQFQMGALPLVDGLHLRGFIANLLQCDPLRVTKKYSGHAIGKQNFYYQRTKSYCYNLHTKMQKRISSLRNHFYWHIQYRCKFGYAINIQELKAAEADYWIKEFIKFAAKIGQRVEMATAPVAVHSPVPSQTPSSSSVPSSVLSSSQASSTTTLAEPPFPVKSEVVPSAPLLQNKPRALSVDVTTEDETETHHHPSFKLATGTGAVSPLSFDEWREEEAPAFIELLDKTLLTDFARQSQSQFSASLSEILEQPQAAQVLPSAGGSSASSSAASSSSSSSANRCSLKDWLMEEETRWTESMTGTSWSFSLTLSEV